MTLLATAVGVSAVLLLTGMGEGARRFVLEEFSLLGNDVLIVLPGRKETTGGLPPLTGEGTRDLTLDDARAVLGLPGVKAVAPLVVGLTQVEANGRNRELMVVGTSEAFFQIRQLSPAQGRLLPALELERAEPVCVIGQGVREDLFDQTPVLGRWLRTADRRCRVIGVLENRGVSLGTDMSEAVIIPVASAQQLFDTRGLFRLFVQVRHVDMTDDLKSAILDLIQARHQGERDVTLITQDSLLGVFNDILQLLTLAVGAIAAISLVVAGILIMNITLISVSQRTSEIGAAQGTGRQRASGTPPVSQRGTDDGTAGCRTGRTDRLCAALDRPLALAAVPGFGSGVGAGRGHSAGHRSGIAVCLAAGTQGRPPAPCSGTQGHYRCAALTISA